MIYDGWLAAVGAEVWVGMSIRASKATELW
jgi:hypothetical protein